MSDLLETGTAWLKAMRLKHASRSVVYQRGSDMVEIKATISKTVFQTDKGFGVFESFESRDYLIGADALQLNGASFLPRSGDRIRETSGGKVFIGEVMAPGKEPCWRWSDPYRLTLRIHTKYVGMEDAP
jgi:hypothetical protein